MAYDLYHYYEKSTGPFRSLSDLSLPEAQAVLDAIRKDNATFAAHRFSGYLERRRELEQLVRGLFIRKGGRPVRETPHYMILGECDWLRSWYRDGAFVRIPASAFHMETVSFCYGDMFPTFSPRVADGREYRRQVYTWEEIRSVIARHGLPQEWNAGGRHGPERYVEAHVWSDEPVAGYLSKPERACYTTESGRHND